MTAKAVLITGGNSGLGYEAAKRIAASSTEWHVIIASRDKRRSDDAAAQLRAETSNPSVTALPLDLGSLTSVRKFAADLMPHSPPLRALVCNAGLQVVSRLTTTEDGFETTFAVNHLGHFLLVNLLLGTLVAPARIVVVSSDTHDPARRTGMPVPRWDDPHLFAWPNRDPQGREERSGRAGRRRYTTSKLSNVLFAYELDRRIRARNVGRGRISVTAFNPGFMPGSGLARDYSALSRFAWRTVLPAVAKLRGQWRDVAASGEALARLVIDPALEDVTATYFDGTEAIPSSRDSYDEAKARSLWDVSAELVELTAEESPLG